MIVVMVIAILTAIVIPSFIKIRSTVRQNICLENIRIIRQALSVYKFQNGFTTEVSGLTLEDLMPYMKTPNPVCPDSGVYTDIGGVPYCTVHDDRATTHITATEL